MSIVLFSNSGSRLGADDTLDQADLQIRIQYEELTKKLEALSQQYRAGEGDEEQRKATKNSLASLVGQAFELRQRMQRNEVQAARKDLDAVEQRIAEREELKEIIIRRRVEDLLIGKEAKWNDAQPQSAKPDSDFDRIRPGDVVGAYIEGILPMKNPDQPAQPPPVTILRSGVIVTGFPLVVVSDGTIRLPLLKSPIKISGLTVRDAESLIAQQ